MNWKGLKQLNQLYTEGVTSMELLKFSYAKRLNSMEYFFLDKKILTKTSRFDSHYLKKHKEQFNSFNDLLLRYDLLETNFSLEELEGLLTLSLKREEIIDIGLTLKEISTLYFRDAKRLRRGSKLFEAVLRVLEVDSLAADEHDQQFLSVLHCKNKIPSAIILCENDNQIKKPRLKNIELWHAGGRNTAKLKFVPKPTIPLYYLCDWDNKGMEIYQDIKRNIFPQIELLTPQEPIKKFLIEPKWPEKKWKTNIDPSLFSTEAKRLLDKIIPNKWIEEESICHNLLIR